VGRGALVYLPNTVGDLPNTVGDLPNTVGDLPNTVGDLPNIGGCVYTIAVKRSKECAAPGLELMKEQSNFTKFHRGQGGIGGGGGQSG
jgi:hypothetical protein